MLERIRTRFSTEQAMEAVNVLLFLAVFSGSRLIVIAGYSLWALWLFWSLRRSPSRAVRLVKGILLACAVTVLALNLGFSMGLIGTLRL